MKTCPAGFYLVLPLLLLVSGSFGVFAQTGYIASGYPLHMNASRGFTGLGCPGSITAVLDNDSCHVRSDTCFAVTRAGFRISFRVANRHNYPDRIYRYADGAGKVREVKSPAWGFFVRSGNGETMRFMVESVESDDLIGGERGVAVKIFKGDELVGEYAAKGVDCNEGYNIWNIFADGGSIAVSAGNRGISEIAAISGFSGGLGFFGFNTYPGGRIEVSHVDVESVSSLADLPCEADGPWRGGRRDGFDRVFAESRDTMEGYWKMFGKELDTRMLRSGGEYMLAIVRTGGRYAMVYLSGASVNASNWKPGMVKGYLVPDGFESTYSVIWHDAEGVPLSKDVKAQEEVPGLLTIQFPRHSSVIKLRKCDSVNE